MAQANPFVELFGDIKLQGKDTEVAASSLAGKAAVGLYFSAHWCPPCRKFTPQLVQFYKTHSQTKNFEIIFISSDSDEPAFNTYYGEMPWLALPYAKRDLKDKLSKKWKVSGIPSFVVLDGSGNTITTKARQNVSEDPTAADFPWKPKSLWDILSGDLLNHDGGKVDALSHLKQTTAFGIYFSAHWCGPCRQFTPQLISTYNKLKESGKKFEVVFSSGDNDQAEFDGYFKEMPWLAIPYTDEKKRKELDALFEVEGIPTFVIMDGPTGKVISKNGRGSVSSDPEGHKFPWTPSALSTVEEGASQLNDVPCFIYLDPAITDAQVASLAKVAEEYKAKWAHLDSPPLIFLYGKSGGLVDRVKQFTNITSDKALLVLNIPEANKAVSDANPVTFDETVFRAFVDKFVAGSLPTKGVKD